MKEILEESTLSKATNIILDFSEVDNVERTFYPEIAKFKKLEKDGKITFLSQNLSRTLQTELMDNGVDELFNIRLGATKPEKKVSKRVQAEALKVIIPFIEATVSTFKIQVDIDVSKSNMYQKEAGDALKFNVISLISINGRNFEGNIALCFTNDVILNVYNKMTFDDGNEVTDEVAEGAAELLNIIFGTAKKDLNDNKNYQMKKAIPTVMRGEGVQIKQKENPIMVLPFSCEFGMFFIEIEIFMNPNKED